MEALKGSSHVFSTEVSTTHCLLKAVFETAPGMGMVGRAYIPGQGSGLGSP